ncbi:ATP-binding sensor histidine kinase [Calothrix sp. PCC 7507]|uniref:trifunctional serine/threonine-protein kinase/ATP-binding protein/sensor histidine kinase n=1 Tax=Calothrix sp. PCC 7507 TaxID=99598 RepID=UPI00029ECA57|nr:ATP-binding sensor histidine kinase [Calothrix sp. PCC 7507]AFY36422.1 multi-sensor signal transduction multi-kinase [Calothrix sp. PCC 7507]
MASTLVSIPGYQISKELYDGYRTVVYRGYRQADSLPVVIKLLKNPYPSFSELVQFRNQYTIAKNLNSPLIIATYSLEPYQNGYGLVMEDFGGIPLKEMRYVASLQEFLEVAIALCNSLNILYHEQIIHKDIKPSNILINPETKQVKLIDFSIASLLPRETQEIQNASSLEGTLAYLSPEQTGRMNRGIDYRSDFYSLGVTFYELLTGQLPFVSDDPMELVHCHLAKIPVPIHQINSHIPLALSEIISKLMAKNAEDRYQSALGIKHDLEICLEQLKKTGSIKNFILAEGDISDRFLIPEKLYGRETEVSTLLQAFERVSKGATEIMLVAGFSGIGKTAVVNEVHKPIVRQRGYFIKGKYDQFQRNIPFSAFVQTFRDLMGQLLSESDAQLQIWKTKILEVIGDNGQVLIDVIPELERIIGAQPPATELSGTAAQNRFNLLMQKFVQIFTSLEHPLVMFLDDLQWADSASLKLLQLLMSGTGHLLILGAYRDNEVSPGHPFMLTVDEIVKTGATVNTITLSPLSLVEMNRLVADTLNCEVNLAQPLTELVFQKTQGNPFFATQFLKALHEDRQIIFNWETRYWQCDIAQVKALALTDDVVEFMALQLQKLPAETQNVLKLAACIGAQFDLNTLAIVSERSPETTAANLWKALQLGLIIPNQEIYKFFIQSDSSSVSHTAANPIYRFLHDRVQQAAYSLILADQKQATHLKIGQLLLQESSESQRQERIFDIVGHFNFAQDLICDRQSRYQLASLNLQAGKTAKGGAAFQTALVLANIGIHNLPSDSWQEQYNVTLALHNLAAEAAYLCSQFAQAKQLITLILQQAKQLIDKVSAYETQILAYLAQGQPQEAIYTAIDVLGQFGIRLPKHPTQAQVLLGLAKTKLILGNKKPEQLVNLPNMTDPNKLAAMRILSSAASAAYLCAPKLMPLLVFERVNLSVRHGNTALSAFGYAWYGLILCGILMDIEGGYEFGQLALQLLERFNATDLRAKVLFMTYTFISHWRDRITDTMPALLTAYQSGLETGDVEYAAWAALVHCYNRYWTGENLKSAEPAIRSLKDAIAPFNQKNGSLYIQIYHQATLNLLGHADDPSCLSGESYQVAEDIPAQIAASDRTGLFFSYVCQQHLHYLFGQYVAAVEKANAAKPYFENCVSSLPTVLHYFYDSLAQLAIYATATAKERRKILKNIQANQQKLKKWGFYAPMNYQHKFLLVEAERYRVLGQKLAAQESYDQAIQLAKDNQFLNEEALANELAAKFYLNWGKTKIAQVYMIEAYYCYARWGAKAKVVDLETRYPQLLQPVLQQLKTSFNVSETLTQIAHSSTQSSSASTSISDSLDFVSVIKAAQVISSTIEFDELLQQLTQIILQNSGANKCVLILPQDETWLLRAISTPEATEICSEPIDNHPHIPIKLIQYVKRTQALVMVDNLQTDLPIIDDYLLQHQPKSLLCLPILNQGHLAGILYLKNEITAGVFTSDRLSVVNLLCTQAAISLENARLYQQAKLVLRDLQQAQLQIVQSEKMSALGNLVAGVAHEMNNPLGFIAVSLEQAKPIFSDIVEHLKMYQEILPLPGDQIIDHAQEIDLEYSLEDLPKMIDSMSMACDRLKNISTSLRTFSRADRDYKVPFNIHEGIDSTILILKHRLKANEERPAIEVITNYANLPEIECFPGQLNQVFMNILANAIDALDEFNYGRSFEEIKANPNCITITTSVETNLVKIAIADNGKGMSEEVKSKIFDHLFTTKAVGKGTGLGLAIARQIVESTHSGKLTCHSVLDKGTEFVIEIPVF